MRLFQVDAFTDKPFGGNPAAVCLLDGDADAAWMQSVASEMNLSETSFLLPRDDGWSLRWFTPAVEVDLCGHATLASAHVLWQTSAIASSETARFHTRSGLLTADRRGDWIELDFPVTRPEPTAAPPTLLEALGTKAVFVGRSRFDYLVEVESEEVVRGLHPDFALLRSIPVRGVSVTSRSSTAGYDFVSRFFAPGAGIDEDPVTGSAHCALTPYWAERLGKSELVAYQASARGGVLRVGLLGERVKIAGRAVMVFEGDLMA